MAIVFDDETQPEKKRIVFDDPALNSNAPTSADAMKDGFAAFVRGGADGVSLGLAPRITAAIRAPFTDKTFAEERNESQANYDARKKEHPYIYNGSKILGSALPGLAVPEAAAPRVAGLGGGALLSAILRNAATNGAMGAVEGGARSNATDIEGKAMDAALGGLTGAAGGAGFSLLSRAAEKPLERATELISEKISPKLAGFFERNAAEQSAKHLGAKRADFGRDEIERTREVGRFFKDKGVIKRPTGEGLMEGADELERGAVGKINGPVEAIDASGLRASSGKALEEKIRAQFWSQHPNFKDFPPALQEKLLAGQPTGTALDAVAAKVESLAKTAGAFGDEPMTFEGQRRLKTLLQDLGNFDSESRALRVPKKVSSIARKDLEQNVNTAAEILGDDGLAKTFGQGNREYGLVQDGKDFIADRIARDTSGSPFKVSDAVWGEVGGVPAWVAKKYRDLYGNATAAYMADAAAGGVKLAGQKLPQMLKDAPEKMGRLYPALRLALQRGPLALAVENMGDEEDPEQQALRSLSNGRR